MNELPKKRKLPPMSIQRCFILLSVLFCLGCSSGSDRNTIQLDAGPVSSITLSKDFSLQDNNKSNNPIIFRDHNGRSISINIFTDQDNPFSMWWDEVHADGGPEIIYYEIGKTQWAMQNRKEHELGFVSQSNYRVFILGGGYWKISEIKNVLGGIAWR